MINRVYHHSVERKRWLLVTCAVGLAFGVAASVANAASSPYQGLGSGVSGTTWARVAKVASLLLDAGWSWAALAVAAGWRGGTLQRGLIAGPTALIAASASYFCSDAALRGERLSLVEVGVWAAVGLVLGPPLGAVGDRIRETDVWGVLAGLTVPVGAAVQMLVLPPGLARAPNGGWVPNTEADLARHVVWGLAALASIVVLARTAIAGRLLRRAIKK